MSILIFYTIFSFILIEDSLLSILLHCEWLVILLFMCSLFFAVILNINWLFGFAFCLLILSSLEVALSLLIMTN